MLMFLRNLLLNLPYHKELKLDLNFNDLYLVFKSFKLFVKIFEQKSLFTPFKIKYLR